MLVMNYWGNEVEQEVLHRRRIEMGYVELVELYSYRHGMIPIDCEVYPEEMLKSVTDIIPEELDDDKITFVVRFTKTMSTVAFQRTGSGLITCHMYLLENGVAINERGKKYVFDGERTDPVNGAFIIDNNGNLAHCVLQKNFLPPILNNAAEVILWSAPGWEGTATDGETVKELDRCLRNGQKIQAIKAFRKFADVGLKDANDIVDRLFVRLDRLPF